MRQETVHEQPVTGGWELAFPSGWGAPEKLHLDSLRSWTEVPDDGVRYFSGTATYSKRIFLDRAIGADERLVLELGDVREFAEVTVNGVSYPVLWKPPFRLDITDAVMSTSNVPSVASVPCVSSLEITIRVTNLWPNRLIGDERLPPDREWKPGRNWLKEIPDWVKRGDRSPTGRHTFTTWHHWTKDDKLLPSGLIGPVALQYVRFVDANGVERKIK